MLTTNKSEVTKMFSKRFVEACEESPNIPPYGKGRQTVIASKLDVSQEAVRKWFTGESMPKPSKMKKLAELLDVEQAWLALGVKSEIPKDARKLAGRVAEAAVMFVAGTIGVMGGTTAFPSDGGVVDIRAIIRGRAYDIYVSSAREIAHGVFELIVPKEIEKLRCVAYIPGTTNLYDLLDLPVKLLEKYRQRRSADFFVIIDRVDGNYVTGQDTWPKFNPLGDPNE